MAIKQPNWQHSGAAFCLWLLLAAWLRQTIWLLILMSEHLNALKHRGKRAASTSGSLLTASARCGLRLSAQWPRKAFQKDTGRKGYPCWGYNLSSLAKHQGLCVWQCYPLWVTKEAELLVDPFEGLPSVLSNRKSQLELTETTSTRMIVLNLIMTKVGIYLKCFFFFEFRNSQIKTIKSRWKSWCSEYQNFYLVSSNSYTFLLDSLAVSFTSSSWQHGKLLANRKSPLSLSLQLQCCV